MDCEGRLSLNWVMVYDFKLSVRSYLISLRRLILSANDMVDILLALLMKDYGSLLILFLVGKSHSLAIKIVIIWCSLLIAIATEKAGFIIISFLLLFTVTNK
jgi:hypothetical protein